ncbi:MAG: hypothetical protein NT155_01680 [Candidatus Staskawiczbacteria bacterium]|nr:hypothetical protein [Candidatus Staskawiczbacteria bacterium]
MSIVTAAYDKAGLSDGTEGEAQRINDTPGLSEHIATWIEEHRAPQSKYAGKKVRPAYDYPREYKGPKSMQQQAEVMLRHFPGFDPEPAFRYYRDVQQKIALPNWVEGAFLVPWEDALSRKYFPEVKDPAEMYCRALQLIFQKIAESRSFTNWRENQIDAAHIRVSQHTREVMQKMRDQQQGDFRIQACQLGKRWGGYCVGLARESFTKGEYGLTSVAGGSIVLVHPERLVRWEELDMDMAGDEFSDDCDGRFGHAPYFGFSVEAKFGADDVSSPSDNFGSASGFVSQ